MAFEISLLVASAQEIAHNMIMDELLNHRLMITRERLLLSHSSILNGKTPKLRIWIMVWLVRLVRAVIDSEYQIANPSILALGKEREVRLLSGELMTQDRDNFVGIS